MENKLGGQMLSFIGCDAGYVEADIVMFGVPYDGTASYRAGSRFAPACMRNESYAIETYSPYFDADLTEFKVRDGGDMETPFGNAIKVLDMVSSYTNIVLADGKIPCMIGGEHLITLGAIRAFAQKYPNLILIHFDAHTDLREEYLGEELSHATVIRKCHDILGNGKIFQFGIRSGTKEEFVFAGTQIRKFDFEGLDDLDLAGKDVYLTIDLDVLDPSILSGTGTPEVGGVSFNQLVEALRSLKCANIVGADLVELAPHYDASGNSTLVACKVLRELLITIGKSKIKI